MNWTSIHITRDVAAEVGKAAARSGVSRAQAIAAALWIFSRLTTSERADVIRAYLFGDLQDKTEPRPTEVSQAARPRPRSQGQLATHHEKDGSAQHRTRGKNMVAVDQGAFDLEEAGGTSGNS